MTEPGTTTPATAHDAEDTAAHEIPETAVDHDCELCSPPLVAIPAPSVHPDHRQPPSP